MLDFKALFCKNRILLTPGGLALSKRNNKYNNVTIKSNCNRILFLQNKALKLSNVRYLQKSFRFFTDTLYGTNGYNDVDPIRLFKRHYQFWVGKNVDKMPKKGF